MRSNRIRVRRSGLLADFRYRRGWKWATLVLSVVVLLGTLSALVLPGVTLESLATTESAEEPNPTDIGPDSIPVDYYVYINGAWEKVGETSTGWISGYNGGASSPNGNYNRDYITEAQVASVLGMYGFKSEGNSARTIAYQNSADGVDSRVWSDTTTAENDGVRIIPLSLGTGHYNIYFLPDNTTEGTVANRSGISGTFGDVYQFYSLEVFDPQKLMFQTEAEADVYDVVFRSGSDVTITLPKPPSGDWMIIHDGGELNSDLHFTDNGNETMSITINNLTQHLRLAPKGTSDFGPDEISVTFMVYLDDEWKAVGSTKYAWKGDYDITDWDNNNCRDAISINQMVTYLGPYGFDIHNTSSYQLAYRKHGEAYFYADTGFSTRAGHKVYCLAKDTSDVGYRVYFMPGNTAAFSGATSIPTSGSKFYSITVKDKQNWVYSAEELAKVNSLSAYDGYDTSTTYSFAAAALKGETAKVTVERAGWAWMWFKSDGTYADVTGYKGPAITYEDPDESDGLITMTRADTQFALVLDAGDKSQTASTAGSMSGDIQAVSGQGITFKLFDYRADINDYLKQIGLVSTPTWTNNKLQLENYFAFRDEYTPWAYTTLNIYYDRDGYHNYDNGGPDHTTVYRNLSQGYPILDLTHKGNLTDPGGDGTSLDFLFSGNEYVKQYNCVNTPLWYDTSDGYYKYSSVDNAADYDTVSNTWYIRNFTERGASTAQKYPGYADFLPFNNGTGAAIGSINDQSYQYEIENVDYWFGMSMSVNFYQGKDGMIAHNGVDKEMEFHFSGDDDVWLFVDEMLVLDIGGTHGAVDGTVNFHTGLVKTWYNFNNDVAGGVSDTRFTTSTLYECYKAALIEAGVSNVSARLNEIFVATDETVSDDWGNTYPVYRFKDYSSHSMKFFYMERGADASNCSIRFNLPTLPDETLFVGKELEFDDTSLTAEQIAFAKEHLAYRFRVVDADGNPIFKDTEVTVYDETLEGELGVVRVDSDGWFTLKAGQRAKFEHMLATLQELNLHKLEYYVQEAIPSAIVSQYNGVIYRDGGTSGEVSIEGVTGSDWVIYKTGALSPENTYTVIYTNKVDVEKMSFLQIRKEVLEGSIWNGTDTFTVQVMLGGQEVAAGTVFTDVATGESVLAGENGTLTLKHGQTLQLAAPVLAGTEFAVKELDQDGWQVGYTVAYNGTAQSVSGGDGVSGTVPVGTTVLVTVKNSTFSFSVEIPITKQFVTNTAGNRVAVFQAVQVMDKNGTALSGGPQIPQVIEDVTLTCSGSAITAGRIFLGYPSTTANGIYYYLVTEKSFAAGAGEYFTGDTTAYVAEITVTDGKATLTALYQNGEKQADTAPAAFVNVECGTLVLEKIVTGAPQSNAKFSFTIAAGLSGTFQAELGSGATRVTFADGKATVELAHGESIRILGIPSGTAFTITESAPGYQISYQIDGGQIHAGAAVNGSIGTGTVTTVVCTNHCAYELPDTGGIGTFVYIFSGLAMILCACALMYRSRRQMRRGAR